MKIYIILNPNAGSAKQAEALREAIHADPAMTLWETKRGAQASELAAAAVQEGAGLVVAAGGDGTINEVVNGLASDFSRARLGILPLGTGNDLARTLALPAEPLEALRLLKTGPVRALDVMRVKTTSGTAYGINVAAGGFTGQVNELMTDELKASWGPLAYLRGAVSVLPNLTDYETFISWEDGTEERIAAFNIIVANGRTAAGGFMVAPTANPEDGLLDVVIVQSGSLLDLAGVAARLVVGNYVDSDLVLHRQVRRVRVAARPGMWFNVDGELLTKDPVSFSILPRALQVVVGTGYTPEPQLNIESNATSDNQG
jgi:diacylglycerol kinase (ATP)